MGCELFPCLKLEGFNFSHQEHDTWMKNTGFHLKAVGVRLVFSEIMTAVQLKKWQLDLTFKLSYISSQTIEKYILNNLSCFPAFQHLLSLIITKLIFVSKLKTSAWSPFSLFFSPSEVINI